MATVIGVVVFILVVAAIYVATRPKAFHVERSAQINAPVDVVFPLINNLQRWPRWSPFEKLDPNMNRTFEGPPAGPGAISTWHRNSKAGGAESRPVREVVGRVSSDSTGSYCG